MTTWIVGDVHGCADELEELLGDLALGADDAFVSVGDLFHRGPDPARVARLLAAVRARFVLGNHELRVLERLGLAPEGVDARRPSPRPPLPARARSLAPEDLDGDGRTPCDVAPEERAELVEFLLGHDGFVLRRADVDGAGRTRDGREWLCVHAGLVPGLDVEENDVDVLTSIRRLDEPGRPWWYEVYGGPDLVLFGHTPSRVPRVQRDRGRVVAIGLDTGCVYGGRLTAYSPELDEFRSVAARLAYARA